VNFHAFVDESELSTGDSPGVYLLAAAVITVDHLDTARTTIEALRLRGQRKLHWRDENDNRRMLSIKTIATLPALHVVVVRAAADECSERRRRRLCLRRLLCELDQAGVVQVILERRQRRQDQADSQLLSALRAAKAVSSGLHMEHAAGTGEPLLWLPDFVAGAAGAAYRGAHSYLDQLTGLINMLKA
jgi:hypothetical protein